MSAAAAGLATVGSALDYIASDLSFTLSYQIAVELLAASREADMADDALVGMVIVVGIVLNTVPRTITALQRLATTRSPQEIASSYRERGTLAFLTRFLRVCERIVLSIVVQLIANAARSEQPVRLQRILALASTSLFFLFLDNAAAVA